MRTQGVKGLELALASERNLLPRLPGFVVEIDAGAAVEPRKDRMLHRVLLKGSGPFLPPPAPRADDLAADGHAARARTYIRPRTNQPMRMKEPVHHPECSRVGREGKAGFANSFESSRTCVKSRDSAHFCREMPHVGDQPPPMFEGAP